MSNRETPGETKVEFVFDEIPYSDSRCVKKEIFKCLDKNEEWGFDFSPSFLCHSKNWCMGTLHIDVFSLGVTIGPWEMFIAYRITVFPPIGTLK